MDEKEVGREFLARITDYLVSLPYDLKILQEAVSDEDLERRPRETAGGVLIHALSHQDGTGPERFVEDVILVRVVLARLRQGGEGAAAFESRFTDVYSTLEADLKLFEKYLGPSIWTWLVGRIDGFSRILLKGKRAVQYLEDQEALDSLYEDGLDFQTNYNVTEPQVRNRLRRPEQLLDVLQRRYQEDHRKRVDR